MQALFVQAHDQGPRQLSMTEAEFGLIRKVAATISANFGSLAFDSLKNVSKQQVDALSAILAQTTPQEPGKVTLSLDDQNYEVLRDVMDFADGYMNEEFENDRDAIIQITEALTP